MCASHLDFFILGESFRVRAANPTYLSPPGGRKSQTSSAPFLGSRMLWECKVWALMTSELRFYNPYKKSCFHEWAVQSNKKLYGLFCFYVQVSNDDFAHFWPNFNANLSTLKSATRFQLKIDKLVMYCTYHTYLMT